MQNALLSLHFINVFPDVHATSTQILHQRAINKVLSLNLSDDLKPYVKIATPSGHIVLNITQWFTLLTFKSDIPKNKVHELGDPRHTLSVYCGRYIRITSENTLVYLLKND
jgi:hypothetical protein